MNRVVSMLVVMLAVAAAGVAAVEDKIQQKAEIKEYLAYAKRQLMIEVQHGGVHNTERAAEWEEKIQKWTQKLADLEN